jgi:hypothetical protein
MWTIAEFAIRGATICRSPEKFFVKLRLRMNFPKFQQGSENQIAGILMLLPEQATPEFRRSHRGGPITCSSIATIGTIYASPFTAS